MSVSIKDYNNLTVEEFAALWLHHMKYAFPTGYNFEESRVLKYFRDNVARVLPITFKEAEEAIQSIINKSDSGAKSKFVSSIYGDVCP